MFKTLSMIWKFINYWYFRYLMVTELYMVETWERVVMNTSILTICGLFFYINYVILCYFIGLIWVPNESVL